LLEFALPGTVALIEKSTAASAAGRRSWWIGTGLPSSMRKAGSPPHYTGHRSRALWLEKLITYMKSKPGVWSATHEEIANYLMNTMLASR
jgi:hypothetical protein